VAVVEWLRHFLLQESNNRRMAYGLAIAGHLIIALILLLGFFERTEPAPIAAMPVEIVMEEPAAASPPPVSTPNERSSLRAEIRGQAEVTGIATPAQALALVRSTQVMMDRHINPNYLANMEVFTETWEGRTIVVLPAGVTVNVGDMIYFDFGHVDPSNPCQYIPNLAVSER
jgi:hypothetical protein